jgi:quercetin dioxygenase-like cupin family protein
LRIVKLSQWKEVFPGIESRVLAYDEECMPVLIRAKPNAVASAHKHKSKQYGFVIKGSAKFETRTGEHYVRTGDSYLIDSYEEHSAVFGSETEIAFLEIFVPARKELLGQQKMHHRNQ